MSLFSNWLWGSSQLDEAIDKATSDLLPAGSEDIALNLEICDQIRSKSIPAKDAMRALKRRLNHKNPNVQLLALGLTDICVKNGGDHFLTEIGSREFIDNLVSILRMDLLNLEVKNTMLRLLQNWSVSFESKPSLGYVGQVCRNLQHEGFKFPPKDLTASNSAMVDTQTAPEWIDSDVCLRCRTPFTFTNRKHHCRNCGQVFDQACSSKTMPLPHFGITQEVRVCDTCYNKMTKRAEKSEISSDKGHRHSASMHSSRHSRARDLADADLQRAIQLSIQEVGAAGGHSRPGYVPFQPSYRYSEPPIVDRFSRPNATPEEDDPDLKAAIEASLQEANAPKPSAPIVVETPRSEQPSYDGPGYSQSYPPGIVPPHPVLPSIPNYDLEPLETDAILTFSQTVEQVQAQGGRDMSRYPAVNELYDRASGLRPKLAMSVDDAGRKEQLLSDMHEQLSQAVKLYDQLLSQQVSHPRWRSLEPAAAPYQAYAAPAGHYAQWAPPNGYQAPAQASIPQPQPSYFSPQEAQPPAPQWHSQQPVSPTVYHTSSPPNSYPSNSQQQTYQVQSPVPAHQTLPQAPTPTPLQYSSLPPSTPQYSSPQPQQQHAPPAQISPSSPTLSHQNPLSYAPSSSLARSNTLATSQPSQPQQAYQQPVPSQLQQYASAPPRQAAPTAQHQHQQHYTHTVPAAPPPAMALPQFPVAPTSAPQSLQALYGPTTAIPSGVLHTEERKEALLIDL
ncbi:hypothetical protein D9757_006796 [Collybiopsis confluens]|uniref:Vacuolar protein sorting-associated protein 27 n=1 Tax=Collybiopsis confluens TaxID=2823264 RepID=A0A8H5HLR4_9AGAR|nr:hypothetical protein D9757_006796 [Collybiopsis confluens]